MKDEQLLRYSRQIMLPDVDIDGQEKLLSSRVLILGLGGLGSPVSVYLAAAGVGHLVLADFDSVDLSNLQRQIVHRTADINRPKVLSAKDNLLAINPQIEVTTINEVLEKDALEEQVRLADAVVDCTDNFSIRFALNAACVRQKTPLISGAAIRLEGQVAVYDSRNPESPCYRCLYQEGDDAQLTCSESGVIAPLVGMIGTTQAMETLKILIGFGKPLVGRLLLLDAKNLEWRSLKLRRDPQCPECGHH
ncbi:molybdopterin-synthase adenylyltransferase MoeB [Motiliproteus sp. MSK22-1]|uniref:molybdopterin-synthase adenylyltransferase MoeB n=1 Tax=Motiliproteus sp. MSK22-1 TaxID=1897630 RepID=UPI000975B341|nr:molybdopterin-synthase adenylyltransferase MoeB [Motiliproteus sp. MSK22-1]OMH39035.1 molybdopterin-synthase adenylyltransferase MoeB [Motiliproteus sp. MSK22-1]